MWWLILSLTLTFSNNEQTQYNVHYDSYQTSKGCVQAGVKLTSTELVEWMKYKKGNVIRVQINNKRCDWKALNRRTQ